ncbi:hypothetical protein PC114_g27407 [Phytophthora cactorum]|nr:hypothetical protein PC114_g27407 [Phytophthora cactorum]
MTAIYVKNRLPSPKIEHKTPFEIVYKSKPSVKHMRVFGCRTYIEGCWFWVLCTSCTH